ncbi:hypothetical protein BV97_05671 [Novosphingobium resinovorum]|uniref:Uncharacterized protein n=1 Tax=Novosphingobium resinovorum TaxID=158500 RepID=A0A031J5M7_9SPHN|nr:MULTISPECIES: hypothetical protein [Novosphingobium]EZP68030.1 hypothetical protein BV97_05671 [Novosphingobium resinovorum]
MFITNALNPGEMLAELLKGGPRVSAAATAEFADLRHDRDLCPGFADLLKTMLGVYKAYGHEVHDIQSFRDDGVDVVMRYEDKDGRERVAGLQIKSEDEFRRWEKKEYSLINTLKGQQATAKSNVSVDEYYVILCVDATQHRTRIRTLCSELKNFRPCEIIEPEDVLNFFRTDGLALWARVTRILCSGDRILDRAETEVENLKPDVAFFLVTLVCEALDGKMQVDDQRLVELWSEWEEFAGDRAGPDDRLSHILWSLTNDAILSGGDSGFYTVSVGDLPKGLCALFFDLKVRSADLWFQPRDHIVSLLQLRDDLAEDEDDEDDDEEEEDEDEDDESGVDSVKTG